MSEHLHSADFLKRLLATAALAALLCTLPLAAQALSGQDAQRFRLALEDFRAGRLEEAGQKLTGLQARHPEHFDIRHLLAIVLDLSGHPEQANQHFQKAVQLRPDAVQARTNLGANLNRLGRTQEAIEQFQQALKLDPKNATAYFNLGTLYLDLRRYQEASPWLEKAHDLQPDVYETGYQLAFCLFALERNQEVRRVLDSLGQVPPERGEFHLLRALNKRALGDEDYEQALSQALQTLSDSPAAHAQVAALLLSQGLTAEALPILRAAVKRFPDSDTAWLNLARAEFATGQEMAQSRVEKALSLRESAPAHRLLADMLDAQDEFAAAASHLQRALELDRSEIGFYELGYFFLSHWNWTTAERVFASGLEEFPDSGRLLLGSGAAKLAQGDDAAAAADFLQASQSEQTALGALRMLAICFTRAGPYFEPAVERFEAFYQRFPQDPRAAYLYALGAVRLAEKTGDFENRGQVEEALQQALSQQPDFFEAQLLLGEMHFQAGRWEEAAHALERAAELNPEHAECRYKLALSLQRSGQSERARAEMQIHQQLKAQQAEEAQRRVSQTKQLIVEMDHKP
ncbi:MAG TPA: tetratricopeptide repeat protein [Acidobacteriota bacterium]|nr:tetratricopeptide repeat protein [Acidobacteriota bacterium]